MKILRLKLTNLNSLQGPHELDFEAHPLAGAGLFAITGPTGSGKSTLLDAITLALYGKIARYGATPSPEDMMSRHCGECAAEVQFRVPSGTYRAEWQLRRARGKPTGQVQAPKRFVYDAAGHALSQNVRETEELIEKLVGLDYPRFLRSAMLAQSEFAQFLRAKSDERAELLESLTGTSIYSQLGTLAHTEFVRRETAVNLGQAAIQHMHLLPEEQRSKLAADIPAAETTFSQVKEELEQANALLNKATNLSAALQYEQTALAAQATLAAERKAAETDLRRLSRHRQTTPFHGDLARLDETEKAVARARTTLAQVQQEHSRALLKAHRCLRAYDNMINGQIESAKAELKGCNLTISAAVTRKSDAQNWLKEYKSDKTLPDKVTNLLSQLADLKAERRDLETQWAELRRLAAKLDPAEAKKLPQAADALTTAMATKLLSRLNRLVMGKQSAAQTASKKADKELKQREDHLAKAKLVASFEEHRAGLHPGDPCPLCGAKKHPFAEGAEPSFPFEDLERRVEKAGKACRRWEAEIR